MISRLQKLGYLTVLLPGLVLAGNAESGKALFGTCVICHGENGAGNAELLAPGVAGQSESYLVRQLWDFRKGVRGKEPGDAGGAKMVPMAETLVDGEAIADVAAFIATMPSIQHAATVEGDVTNGQEQYASKCGACHGGKGWGNEALYTPRLTVIGDWYLIRQVLNFQENMRGAHEDATFGKQMAMMAKTVSAEELNDIAAFLNEQTHQ